MVYTIKLSRTIVTNAPSLSSTLETSKLTNCFDMRTSGNSSVTSVPWHSVAARGLNAMCYQFTRRLSSHVTGATVPSLSSAYSTDTFCRFTRGRSGTSATSAKRLSSHQATASVTSLVFMKMPRVKCVISATKALPSKATLQPTTKRFTKWTPIINKEFMTKMTNGMKLLYSIVHYCSQYTGKIFLSYLKRNGN